MPKTIVKIMSTSVHNRMSITINDEEYSISGINTEQEYPLETRWLLDELLTTDKLININTANGPSGEIYFSEYEVDVDAISEILSLNIPVTEKYITTRTDRKYSLTFSPVSMYAGTYDLSMILDDIQTKIASILTIDLLDNDYHPDQLDFDLQEMSAFALHYLTIHNRDLISVELIK